MTTSLSTEFMSGGFSIQRNEMVSMQQQKHQQKFQFLNSFNQTFTRLKPPAQGEFDRISPYSLSSQRRQFIGGTVTTVTSPLTQTYRNGNQPASLGGIHLTNTGGIESISVLSGGLVMLHPLLSMSQLEVDNQQLVHLNRQLQLLLLTVVVE